MVRTGEPSPMPSAKKKRTNSMLPQTYGMGMGMGSEGLGPAEMAANYVKSSTTDLLYNTLKVLI